MSERSRRLLFKLVAVLFSLGLAGLVSLRVAHWKGFVFQVPFTGLRSPFTGARWPLARKLSRLYLDPVRQDAGPARASSGEDEPPPPIAPVAEGYGEARRFPISKYPMPFALELGPWFPNPELGWLPPPRTVIMNRPAADNPMAPGERRWWQVANNFGFADRDVAVAKPAGEVRIGLFGGSFGQNGSTNDRTIAARLEAALHERGLARVRCLNFAVLGYVITQELAAYAQIASALDLDVVLLLDAGNDLTSPWSYDPRPGYRYTWFKSEPLNGKAPDERRRELGELVGYNTEAWREELVETYLATLRRFRKLAPAPARFVVVPQPMAPHQKFTTLSDYDGEDAYVRHILSVYDRLFARLAEVRREDPSIVVHDLRKVFQGSTAMQYWDVIHVDDRGNDLLGRALAGALAPSLGK